MNILDFFTKCYSSIPNKSGVLNYLRVYSLFRFVIRVIANIVLPVYFRLTNENEKYSLCNVNNEEMKLVVSLTSFPARIDKVWLVVETLFRQTYKPNEIILYLTKSQFAAETGLPKLLLKQKKRGLKIRFEKDIIRAHSKYFFAMRDYPNSLIITVDDDIFYSPLLIESLMMNYNKYANNTLATICKRIQMKNGTILKYRDWQVVHKPCVHKLNFGLGVGGILYPPHILWREYKNKSVFMDKCLYADDVWLYFMTRLARNECRKIDFPIQVPLPILIRGDIKLSSVNVGEDKNDVQIRSVYEYYKDRLENCFV